MRPFLLFWVAIFSGSLWAGWTAIGPFGGSAAFIQVDARHPGNVIAATVNAQLFRSEDDGDSWKPIPFPAQFRATLHAFVLDPRHPGVYLAGLSSEDPEYSGILRSVDAGVTWARLPDPQLTDVWSIAPWPQDPRLIAAGTSEGIFLTHNGGDTWERISPPDNRDLRPVVSLAFDPWDSKILYAGTPHLPWKTMDGGATWVSIHEGMSDDSDVFSILVEDRRRQRLFASTCGGIYRSLDRGEKWTRVTEAVGASYRTYQITQHLLRPNVLFAGTTLGLIKSVDGGATWRRLSGHSTRWIAFDPVKADRIFVATDEAGLFRSDDLGETLQPINQGFCNRRVSSVVASGSRLYATVQNFGGPSVLQRDESENLWEEVPSLVNVIRHSADRIVSAGPRFLYLVTGDGLLVSSDSGQTWDRAADPSPQSKLRDLLLATSDGNRLLVGMDDGIYQSDDAGQTWRAADSPDLRSSIQRVLARGPRMFGVLSPEALFHPRETYGLVPTEDHGLLAATPTGLLRSNDLGLTWRSVTGVLNGSTVSAICKHPTRAGVFFASQYGRVFRSTDDGHSWTPIRSQEAGAEVITGLLVLPGSPDQLLILMANRGVYMTSLPSE